MLDGANSRFLRSDDLHSRVQEFISATSQSSEEFEQLALAIARYQADCIPGYARLVQAHNSRLDRLDTVPAVPVEAFRLTRIAAHPPEADVVRYLTSGTTAGMSGVHVMRRTDTYRASAVTWGRQALLPIGTNRAAVVTLLPAGNNGTSSLSAMAQMFMDAFDLVPDAPDDNADTPPRWLLTAQGVNIPALATHLERARDSNLPLLIVATALSLIRLLDDLQGKRVDIWPQTVVMPTGGFKGTIREISALELRTRVAAAFGIDERQIVGEYGMTELSSQLYEGCLLEGGLIADRDVYRPPPWLHVCPVDPETLRPAKREGLGVARFVDLANVDSAVCVVTQDVICRQEHGFKLLGRRHGAPPRGCSLSTEEWVAAHVEV